MEVHSEALPNIACSRCARYLSSAPVMMTSEGKNVCKNCSTINSHRNIAYESLAQYMLFPCQNSGCDERIPWNTAKTHEISCKYNSAAQHKTDLSILQISEKCVLCDNETFHKPTYRCLNSHVICMVCALVMNPSCPICDAKIEDALIFVCRNWTSGCTFKNYKDKVVRHEVDCPLKGYHCALSCGWVGNLFNMYQHVRSDHRGSVFEVEQVERCYKKRDDSWVMLAHGDIFKCSVWVGVEDVEWIAKFIGPQERCDKYYCELKIFKDQNKKEEVSKITGNCVGWNNAVLEKCIKVPFEKIPKNVVLPYTFKIYKRAERSILYERQY